MKHIIAIAAALTVAFSAAAHEGCKSSDSEQQHKCSDACKDSCKATVNHVCTDACKDKCAKKQQEKSQTEKPAN